MNTIIAPSLLAADYACLGDEVRAVEDAGADWLHLDVMDGHFVPNISYGAGLVAALRDHTSLPFDVHLMISPTDFYLQHFADAGAAIITIHAEAGLHTHRSLEMIKDTGCRAGLALNPGTSIDAITPLLDIIDLVLLMTVNPGFGGQHFIPAVLPKIRKAKALIQSHGGDIDLEVDGGINAKTAPLCCDAGANVLVAGSAIFGQSDYTKAVQSLRQ